MGQLARVDESTGIVGTTEQVLGTLSSPNQPTSYKYNVNGEMVEITQGNRLSFSQNIGGIIAKTLLQRKRPGGEFRLALQRGIGRRQSL